jgi:hypothetical protein
MNDYGYNSHNDMAYDTNSYADVYSDYCDLVESDYENSVKNKKYL